MAERIPRKEERLEDRLLTVEDLEGQHHELYMPDTTHPEAKKLWERIHNYWETVRPKNIKDYVVQAIFPPAYALWKLPPDLQEKINTLLKYSTQALGVSGQEELAAPTGLLYAVSQTIYGLKTRQGKHVGAGLSGIIHHAKKDGNEKFRRVGETLEPLVEKYFHSFDPAKVA